MNALNSIIFLILILKIISQQTSFEITLIEKKEKCFKEYYKTGTVIIMSIYSENPIGLTIYMPSKQLLYGNITENHQFSFISEENDYYEFCMFNENENSVNFTFIIKCGIAAKDFSSLAKTRDFQKSEIEIEKIIERKKNIQHFYSRYNKLQRFFEISLDNLTNKIISCSCIIIFVMIVIGGLETYYLKKFMERRKII